ncbi:Bug family tripartite tricarboxylate transporter substrate binding protein [Caenimonas aquaedulcis]|uniref:Tripartite tricarboxylate transporter substrate binding protein n=1 Tax=Caenimonas aquaedulcis TaxID=2793270 RepID=A0A931MH35_9BURK|nr:tripartite tricarboxylate transporter substrate binding protein [Caenimonas aquaedulcis]MBG9388592.1 tripartite tricarboxylate transporter substrate binding protein [Caenimonas aquaedulcis]
MRRRQLIAWAGASGTAMAWPAHAASTLRIVVAYPPGGISDRIARLLAIKLAPILDATVIVENQAGAGGSVALAAVSRAAPDGRTLGFSAISPIALSHYFGRPAPRVVPVSGVMHTPLLLVGTSALAARSFADMVTQAREHPGTLRWATSGIATIGHLAVEQVKREMRVDVVHVPYSGGAPQLQDALAGRFELLSTNLAPLQIDYVRSGQLHALALGAPQRSPLLPSLPTFTELGCPGANLSSLFGLFAPDGTSGGVVARLNAACAQVLAQPEFRQVLIDGGNLPATGSAADFVRAIERESRANARLAASMPAR